MSYRPLRRSCSNTICHRRRRRYWQIGSERHLSKYVEATDAKEALAGVRAEIYPPRLRPHPGLKAHIPRGPWHEGPMQRLWLDDATNLWCLVIRHPSLGTLNGYVGVDHRHPLYGIPEEDVPHSISGRYSGSGPGWLHNDHGRWWFGFASCDTHTDLPADTSLGATIDEVASKMMTWDQAEQWVLALAKEIANYG